MTKSIEPKENTVVDDRLILRGADEYDEARFARMQRIRAERDPKGLFAGYLAGPGGFRNRNGWETTVHD
jgi:hypothetical protein